MQKPKKEADLLSRPLTENRKMGKNGSKNGKKWQNIVMPFIAKIKPLKGTENLPYKEYHPHPQNATEKEIDPLQSIPKAKPTNRTQNKTKNTDGEPPKIALEPPNVSPHISERPRKKKKPHRAKNALQGITKAAHDLNRERHFFSCV